MDKALKNDFYYTVSFISPRIKNILEDLNEATIENIQEIRMRKGKPVVIVSKGESSFLTNNSKTTYIVSNNCVVPTENEIIDTINKMCGYSMHTQAENISNGYITLKNGCRIGLAGTAVCENGHVKSIKDISSLNIRIPRNITNISDDIFEYFIANEISNLIVVGPPNCGKTTMLKDIAFQFSSGRLGKYYKVCIIDERNELYSSDFSGPNTDVLSGFKKDKGVLIALRTLSPDIIVCDEINDITESKRILEGMNSGVKFIISLHASNKDELLKKEAFNTLIDSAGFDLVAFLSNTTTPGKITDLFKIERHKNELNFCRVDTNFKFFYEPLFDQKNQDTYDIDQTMCVNA